VGVQLDNGLYLLE